VPYISVIMPVHNGERFLGEAVESILAQTYRDFELIIVDDGSTDGTSALLERYRQVDPRVRLYQQPANRGVYISRNLACQHASGQVLALMDADDVSLPDRFQRQVEYLNQMPEIGVVGSAAQAIDEGGAAQNLMNFPTMPGVLGWMILFSNFFVLSSVMIRRSIMEQLGYYRTDVNVGQDFDLWARAGRITQMVNLPEPLVKYRVWNGNMTAKRFTIQEQTANRVVRDNVSCWIGQEVTLEVAAALRSLNYGSSLQRPIELPLIRATAEALARLRRAYCARTRLTSAETQIVSRDAAYKHYVLARLASQQSPALAIALIARGLRISPDTLGSAALFAARKAVRAARRP
jgi:glycosyltransferase involved in cell wall biosynthesis